jgi:hypothetical protein
MGVEGKDEGRECYGAGGTAGRRKEEDEEGRQNA